MQGEGGGRYFLRYLISGADVKNEWSYASTPRLFLQGEDMNNSNIFYLLSNQLIIDQLNITESLHTLDRIP